MGIEGADARRDLRDGLAAFLPLLPSCATVAIAFSLVGRAAGLSGLETQLLSATLFAGAAQFTFADLYGEGSGALAIAATVLLLNLRHVLYGLSANRWLARAPGPPRALMAHLLVDESYGLAEARAQRGRPSGWFLVGVGAGLWVTFNLSTLLGVVAGEVVDIPAEVGLDFVFPLSFVAITLPLVRDRRHVAAVGAAAATAVVASRAGNSGLTILAASLVAVAVGAALERGGDGDDGGGRRG